MSTMQILSPRQMNYLGMALLSGMLALPIAMLLTKLIATTVPPLMVAPAPSEPLERARPAVTAETSPVQVLPTESVPPETAPIVTVPSETIPATMPPSYATSIPFPPSAPGAPDAIPGLSGSLPLAHPGAKSVTHLPLTPHAAVVALLEMMSNAAINAQAARHVLKSVAAGTRAGHAPQKPGAATAVPRSVEASAIDPVTPNFGVIGGPTTSRTGTPGLNGTAMRHRL